MAVLESKYPTLIDVASRLDPQGKVDSIVEILNETNEMIDDAVFIEANDGTAHKTTIRTGLPEATWRQLYQGVQPTKGTTAQIRDAAGMLEAYAQIDKALAELNGNSNAFRMSEEAGHIEGMSQTFQETAIYGNSALNPEKFMGLAARYNSLSAANGQNIISGSGAGSDNTSIYLVGWSPKTVHFFYPKGSKAGLQHKDLGEVTHQNSDGSMYQVLRSHYKWDAGLSVRDWRYVVRIANIDRSDLSATEATGAKLIDLMIMALEKIPNPNGVKLAFYCNRDIKTFLRLQTLNKNNVQLSMDEVAGKKVLSFGGVPVRTVDAILNTEAAVS